MEGEHGALQGGFDGVTVNGNGRGYGDRELRSNRSALFLFGGTEAERRSWAEDAAEQFPAEGPLMVLGSPGELPSLLARTRGVVFVPDVLSLPWRSQGQLLHCLLRQE